MSYKCKLKMKSEICSKFSASFMFVILAFRRDFNAHKDAVQKMLIDLVCNVNIKVDKARAS